MRRAGYERDTDLDGAWREVRGPAVAWRILGWETEPDEDSEWSGIEVRTGRVVAVMVGDDSKHSFDPDDLVAIDREAYCGGCGQLGCGHDGVER